MMLPINAFQVIKVANERILSQRCCQKILHFKSTMLPIDVLLNDIVVTNTILCLKQSLMQTF